jgi:hypothetical protein
MNGEVSVKAHDGEFIRADVTRVEFDRGEQKKYYQTLLSNNRYVNDNE